LHKITKHFVEHTLKISNYKITYHIFENQMIQYLQ